MKMITLFLTLFAGNALAQKIEGTLVLKGSRKAKIVVNAVKTTCRVKVEKIKNLMQEDSFGNPAYNVRIDVALSGRSYELDREVDFHKEFWVNNLFSTSSGAVVKDLEYTSVDGAKMSIDRNGRILSISFPYEGRLINCSF